MAGNGWAKTVHQVPHLIANGISKNQAINALAFTMIFNIASTLIWPTISDFIERKKALLIALVLQVVGTIVLINAKSTATMYLFIIISGISYTGCYALFSALAADLFGRKSLGTVSGTMATFSSLGAAVAIYLGGYAYDMTNSYSVLWYGAIIGLILSITCIIYLGRVMKAESKQQESKLNI